MTNNSNKKKEVDINGIDLALDSNVTQLCQISNETSDVTRNTLYVLVITMLLIIIAVINTNKDNWKKQRINSLKKELYHINNMRPNCDSFCLSFFDVKTETEYKECIKKVINIEQAIVKENLQTQILNGIEHNQTVNVPIVGITFDINDLGNISGLTFIILLGILWFTFKRESNNLKIALNAINARYSDNSDEEKFRNYIENYIQNKAVNANYTKEYILGSINMLRRKHHYNYLSMNQIYNAPLLEVDPVPMSIIGKLIHNEINRFRLWMYFIPFVIYSTVVINDYGTLDFGTKVDATHAIHTITLTSIFALVILLLSILCTNKKFQITNLYDNFFRNSYKYVPQKDDNLFQITPKRLRKPQTLIRFTIFSAIGVLLTVKLLTGHPALSLWFIVLIYIAIIFYFFIFALLKSR